MKAADRIAEVLKTPTVASRRRGDQFTAQGGDLAVFGLTMVDWHSIAREVDWRRWRCDAIVCAGRKPQARQVELAMFGIAPPRAGARSHLAGDLAKPGDDRVRLVEPPQMSIGGCKKAVAWYVSRNLFQSSEQQSYRLVKPPAEELRGGDPD